MVGINLNVAPTNKNKQTNKNHQIVAGWRTKLAEFSYLNFYLYLHTILIIFHCYKVFF